MKKGKKEGKVIFRKHPWKWFLKRVSGRGCKTGQIPKELARNK